MIANSQMLQKFSQALVATFHSPSTRAYRWLHGAVWTLILLSILLVLLEFGVERGLPPWVQVVDRIILVLFAVEITLRVLTFRPPLLDFYRFSAAGRLRAHLTGRLRYLAQPLNLIDLLTVVALVPELRGLRGLRLLRAVRLFKNSSPLEGLFRAFSDNAMLFTFALSVLGVAVGLGGITMYLVEFEVNEGVKTLGDGIWWALVTVTTVGFGDITPETFLGRLTAGFLMVLGMFMLALFAGIVGTTLLNTVLSVREEGFRMMTTLDHIVVCGYDAGARGLLSALHLELGEDKPREVVLFGPGERPFNTPPRFRWVSGDPTKESEMAKVRLTHAHTAIIVAPRRVSPQEADAITILTAFTMRSFLEKHPENALRRRPLHVVAEILDAENVEHARSAGANEVVESGRLGYSMMAHAATMPGTATILSRVAAAGSLNVYLGLLPADIQAPLSFEQASLQVKNQTSALLIGFRDTSTGEEFMNPPNTTPVTAGHQMIYLAETQVLSSPGAQREPLLRTEDS